MENNSNDTLFGFTAITDIFTEQVGNTISQDDDIDDEELERLKQESAKARPATPGSKNKKTEEIEEEELVLVTNPQLEHAWRDYNNKPQNIHEITIQFHSDLLSDQILNRNQMISIRELFHRARKGIVFSRETIAKVRPLLKTLSCENDSFYSLIKLLVILHELSLDKGMRELSTGQFAINSVSKEHTNEKLNKVLDYVHFHFSEVIRLADVAKMVNMSEASFCRFIKQHTSKSFIDFLTDIRLGAASRALVDSSLSIAEIGYDCGFNNLSNFNRIFKKKKGVTPKEFRDNYRKNKTII